MGRSAQHSRTFHWSGYLLGFGLGGFFDGILLHQILQWHHLLSLVEGVGDIRNQVVMDGLFHALMYVIATAGLLLLWHSRHELSAPTAGRLLFCDVLIGFGVWHVLDSVLSHWVLGIHRIKLDSPTPLVWDLIWFAAFGLLPLLIGLLLRRDGGPAKGISGRSAALGFVLAVLAGGWWAGRAPPDASTALVVFRPDATEGQAFNAIQSAGGSLIWKSRGVWAVKWSEGADPSSLYGNGALIVSSSFLAAGCLAWSQV